ncbi:MAG TPA: orotidine-5'-phosphate decarboxylase [Candidatus Omnitrophota bacterium]|nr:orotidine-5'-phosphate decarboxylase [Candidatus Omnitrophota bacterium]
MKKTKTELIVALDVDTYIQAKKLIDKLYSTVKIFKVGSQLFTGCGPKIIEYIKKKRADVFLDLKFHDIPNTVALAVSQATRMKVFMLTVHAQGGIEMMKAASDAATRTAKSLKLKKPLIVAVTVLTSMKFDNVFGRVMDLAFEANNAGIDGVVSSVNEARGIRDRFKDFVIVTPGIRPSGADAGDQKRVATPQAAMEAGSSFIVVGRPIVAAEDQLSAARHILKEMESK